MSCGVVFCHCLQALQVYSYAKAIRLTEVISELKCPEAQRSNIALCYVLCKAWLTLLSEWEHKTLTHAEVTWNIKHIIK